MTRLSGDLNYEIRYLVQEKTAELESALEQKNFYLRELNHRVKNNLSLVASLISLKECDTGQDLADLLGRIHAIGLVHDKLYYADEEDSISVREYLVDLLETLFPNLSPYPVELETNIQDINLNSQLLLSLGLMVNELAINAIKYGFQASNSGAPFPEAFDETSPGSTTLVLIRALVSQIKGSMQLSKSPHPVYTIRFPFTENRSQGQ